jgi:hypothetical protein
MSHDFQKGLEAVAITEHLRWGDSSHSSSRVWEVGEQDALKGLWPYLMREGSTLLI